MSKDRNTEGRKRRLVSFSWLEDRGALTPITLYYKAGIRNNGKRLELVPPAPQLQAGGEKRKAKI
ncbi:MAG: hypothetical protein NVSMB54_35030 [Ktedonobacteraceae bacterium]